MTVEDHKEIVRKFVAEFKNKGNFDVVDELFTENFTHSIFIPGLPEGREGMKAAGQAIYGAFPDVQVENQHLIAEGDLVVEKTTARATHKGDFGMFPATGKSVSWSEANIYRFENGKVAEFIPETDLPATMFMDKPPGGPGPTVFVNDVAAAVEHYTSVLGAQTMSVMDGPNGPFHAVLFLHGQMLMIGSSQMTTDERWQKAFADNNQGVGVDLYFMVGDVDAYYEKVKGDSNITIEIQDQFWGDRNFTIEDPNGFRITFSQKMKDLTPEQMAEAAKAAFS